MSMLEIRSPGHETVLDGGRVRVIVPPQVRTIELDDRGLPVVPVPRRRARCGG